MVKKRLFKFLPILLMSFFSRTEAAWEMASRYIPLSSDNGYFATKIVAWDTQDNAPSPLYDCDKPRKAKCKLTFALGNQGAPQSFGIPEMTTAKTLGEVAELFIKKGFLNREIPSLYTEPNSPVCISFGFYDAVDLSGATGYARLPGGVQCIVPEVASNVCDIKQPYVELYHGQLRAEVIEGNTATAQLTVACTMAFNVRVMSADRSGTIYFNNAKKFRSELKINGVDAGKGLVFKATPTGTTLTLTSTLLGYDGSIGEYQGSKVIVVSLP
ncbi:hypothetical protein B1H39_11970 [Serratia marcescens]|uniref:MrpH family fimbial adhesin n=1 Tax=Serratia marcescens TaxID=615 RepID=UPI0009A47B4D|nr:PapG chaperone-binding domain-containing protein [Serratia marcescens]OPJ94289.1 hypothetical protein B1H39_11970 [Serratia marcescens]